MGDSNSEGEIMKDGENKNKRIKKEKNARSKTYKTK